MPQTLEEILKATGMTDEQIKALDAKAVTALTTYHASANKAFEEAETAKRAVAEQYDKDIAPAILNWEREKADRDIRMASMEAALKSAKEAGFAVPDFMNPANPPPVRDANGKFVANANPVPGSPAFDPGKVTTDLRNELGGAFAFAADTQWRYRTLFNKEMPDSPTALIREAQAARMSPAEFAAKKYDFAGVEAKQKADAEKAKIDAAVKEAVDKTNKDWAERSGNNPMIRTASESSFSTVNKAVTAGSRPDPLKQTPEQRKVSTHQTIGKEIAERSSMVQ